MRQLFGLAGVVLGTASVLHGQDSTNGAPPAAIIDTVVIAPYGIFDSDDALNWYQRVLNGLHVNTRSAVVRRELLLQVGEPFDSVRAAETERNLRRLGVFRYVEIDTVRTEDGRLAARVQTGDGWSTKPSGTFRTSAGEIDFSISLREENFLGTATQIGARFRTNPDRKSWTFDWNNRRTFGSPVHTQLAYQSLSDGTRGAWRIRRPFLRIADKRGGGTVGEVGTTTLLQFADGSLANTYRRRLSFARGSYGWAPYAHDPR